MNTFETDLHRMGNTPPPQIFSSGRGGWHGQVTSRQRYGDSFSDSEQVASPWRQDSYSSDRSDGNAGYFPPSIYSARPAQNTLSDDGSSPWSDSSFTGMPPIASPTAFSPTPPDYQSGSSVQDTIYTAHPPDSYFPYDPNSRYPVKQEQQPASDPQGYEPYSDLNIGGLVISLPPPHQPTRYDEEGGTVADHPNSDSHICSCGAEFGRRTDLERHERTARKHNDPSGPACPKRGCSFTSKFTRVDNFKAHYVKQHRATSGEAEAYIRWWNDQGRP